MADRDRQLKRRLATGDPVAYEAVYDSLGVAMYRSASRMLGCQTEAEDAVQDVFASFVRNRQLIPQIDDLAAYLFVSLRRAVAKRIDRRNRTAIVRLETDIGTEDPSARRHENAEMLQRAVETLPQEQQEVIALKFDGELTFSQISEVLGISANTAASRYRLAMEKLRRQLESDRNAQ